MNDLMFIAVLAYLVDQGMADAVTIERAVAAARDLRIGDPVIETITGRPAPMLRAFLFEQARLLDRPFPAPPPATESRGNDGNP